MAKCCEVPSYGEFIMLVMQIQKAFQRREMPRQVVSEDSPHTSEYQEAMNFQGVSWEVIDSDFLVKNSDALYAFNSEAFCYYLPAFLVCGFEHRNAPPVYVDVILGMLDRSPDPILWDDVFRRRWSLLRSAECQVIELWLLALSECSEGVFDPLTLDRAFDTVQLLINRAT